MRASLSAVNAARCSSNPWRYDAVMIPEMSDKPVAHAKPSPTVSVVMGNYNHARFLPRAIESIANQTRPPDEFLVLDDASTDNSLEVLESYISRIPYLRIERSPVNRGVVETYRRLFEMSTGDYVHPLAADDERHLQCLSRVVDLASEHPQAGLIFGDMVMLDEQGQKLGKIVAGAWREPLYASPERYLREFALREKPSHSLVGATTFRRPAFAEVGWYCSELGSWGDTFAFHAVAFRHGVCYAPEDFAIWHRQQKSYSQQAIANPRGMLDMVERAVALMRSDRFRSLFPETFVRHWSRRYRWQIVKEYRAATMPRIFRAALRCGGAIGIACHALARLCRSGCIAMDLPKPALRFWRRLS